jgi:hypothetical protein
MLYKKKFLLALFGLLALGGCEKDTAGGGSGPKSTWTIDGVTYTETTPASYSTVSNSLSASDNTLNGDIEIQFSTKPPAGSYPVTDLGDTSALINSSNCSILVNTPTTSHYRSSGSHQVVITVGTGGKLTATFSNMLMKTSTTTSSLSGTIIEQ